MPEVLVVDGYNLVFSSPDLKDLDIDHARARLVDTLVNYAGAAGQRVTVVFDAHLVQGTVARTESRGPVDVIFTGTGETADMVIERLVGRLSGGPESVFVVTADYAEQRIILGLGAYRVPPAEFWAQVRRLNRETAGYRGDKPADAYLENRLGAEIRSALEAWRRKKLPD